MSSLLLLRINGYLSCGLTVLLGQGGRIGMRKRLTITLGLILVFACLTVAQVKNQKRRIGTGLTGPVRSVRIERASFSKKGNDYVEGPRVLAKTINVDPEWRRLEWRYHNPDGSVLRANVVNLDADGDQTEVSENDGEGGLVRKIVYIYDDRKRLNEYLIYKSDGTLQYRWVATRPVPGKVEISTYNGDGSFRDRAVNTFAFATPGEKMESSVYNLDGSLSQKTVVVADGKRRVERWEYKSDGSLLARFVDTRDREGFLIEIVEYNEDSSIRRKETFTREFDAQGNWIKETKSEWDTKAGTFVPTAVSYQTITYY